MTLSLRSFNYVILAAAVAVLIGLWLQQTLNHDVKTVLVALQKLEASYRPLPQQNPGPLVIVGFGGCSDLTVNAIEFFDSIAPPGYAASFSLRQKSTSEAIELNSIEDVLDEFTEMFASGAAAERNVHSDGLFSLLVAHAKELSVKDEVMGSKIPFVLGGNAPIMAKRLAQEGAEVTLIARLSPQERTGLPVGVKVLSAPPDFGLPTVPVSDVHLVLEYAKGSVWRNITAPRANRYILIRDKENPRLSSLWNGLVPAWHKAGNHGRLPIRADVAPDLFVVGGLQTMDNTMLTPDIRSDRLAELRRLLSTQLPLATLTHFEMASFVEVAFAVNLTRSILPYIDSIGLNEQELPNLVSLLSEGRIVTHPSVSTPRAAVMLDAMREIWSILTDTALPSVGPGRRRLSRIHLHTLGYQIIMVRRACDPAKARRLEELAEANEVPLRVSDIGRAWPFARAAAAKASLTAHRHTCATASIDPVLTRLLMDDSFALTADPVRWPSVLKAKSSDGGTTSSTSAVPRIHFNSTAPVSCWHEPEPVGIDPAQVKRQPFREYMGQHIDTWIEICVAPVPVCSRVSRTVGAGDNISAGALRVQLNGRAFRNVRNRAS